MFKFLKNIMNESCKEALLETEKKLEKINVELEKLKTEVNSIEIPTAEIPTVEAPVQSEEEKELAMNNIHAETKYNEAMALYYMSLARSTEQETRLNSLKCRELQNKLDK